MDTHDSNTTSSDEKTVAPDSTSTQERLLASSSSNSTSVVFTTTDNSQLGCVIVTDMHSTPVTNLVQTAHPALSIPVTQTAVDGQPDQGSVECEQHGLMRKRSQNASDAGQCEKRNTSMEGTPKRVRSSSSKGNGTTPNRRPRSKSENGASSDGLDSFSVEETLRHLSGSVTPDSADASFRNAPVSSMLEDVLTEKKLTLLRSPEVVQFLQKQQAQKVKENRIASE